MKKPYIHLSAHVDVLAAQPEPRDRCHTRCLCHTVGSPVTSAKPQPKPQTVDSPWFLKPLFLKPKKLSNSSSKSRANRFH